MLKKYFSIIITLTMFGIGLTSCEWSQIEPVDVLPENVSFGNDLIPIFTQSCNSVGCHNSGGISPDLSEENGFNDITSGNMLNIDNPENSELYIRMIDFQSPMPISGILSKTQTDKVLVWIIEGAQNN